MVAVGFLVAFLWSVRSGQYTDTYTPSVRMLFDDEKSEKNNQEKKSDQEEKIDNYVSLLV